ncbi:DUF1573 domain-containing protein [archaeon]|nr:DUF1573 domain-containing protein [archaeon]
MARKTTNKHSAKALKKKQRKETQEKKRKKATSQKKTNAKYTLVLAVSAIAVLLVMNFSGAKPTDPAFDISPSSINLGDVGLYGGPISANFEIRNTGGGILIIDDMETSCGCTSAQIVYDGIKGPLFNMRGHATNPRGWSVEIAPGDVAYLRATYDPLTHPDNSGYITRTITLYSNDPVNSVEEVYIKLNQVS